METTPAAVELPQMGHRWFAFSLRTLFIVLTIFGVWLGLHLQRAKRQKESIAAFKAVAGECYYDFQFQNGRFDSRLTSAVPKWLCDLLGLDFFHNVAEVRLGQNYNRGTGQDLGHLAGVPKLKSLTLGLDHASDAGLVFVGQLRDLEFLSISDESGTVTDVGVAHLKSLRKLKTLYLRGAVEHFAHTMRERGVMPGSRITDNSVKTVASLPRLEKLGVGGDLTNQSCAYVSRKLKLESLTLESPFLPERIDDEGIKNLNGLVNLTNLCVSGGAITPAGLAHLDGLRQLVTLRVLNLSSDGETVAHDVSSFQRSHPNCRVQMQ